MNSPSTGLTQFLAVYAALLSSIGFGWTLYRDLLDRAKLQVSADVRRVGTGADGRLFSIKPDIQIEGASEQLYVVMSVVNVGRRPVLWQGWGGKYRKSEDGKTGFTIIGRDLPKMLQEGETHSELTLLEADLRPAHENTKSLFMWDPAGNHWKLSRKGLKELKQEARKFQGANQS